MSGAGISPEVALVTRCYDAWSARDLPGALAGLSDDCVYEIHVPKEILGFAGRHVGKAAVTACLELKAVQYDSVVYAVDWISGAADIVRARVLYYYTHPRSGEQLEGTLRHVWRVIDGRVVQIDEYHDVAKLEAFDKLIRGGNS